MCHTFMDPTHSFALRAIRNFWRKLHYCGFSLVVTYLCTKFEIFLLTLLAQKIVNLMNINKYKFGAAGPISLQNCR